MNPLHAVDLAVELAHRQHDAAAKALAVGLQQQGAAQAQSEQLESYALETQGKWISRAQDLASPTLMYHHYQFMAKLDQAILFQVSILQNHAQRVAQLRLGLLTADQRLTQFEQVLAARKAVITLDRNRREQRQMDELAAQMTLRKGPQHSRHLGAEESAWPLN